jgi:hypothetical protein
MHSEHSTPPRDQDIWRFLLTGLIGIGVVSFIVFATVAYAERGLVRGLGHLGAYLFWALTFMVGGGWILGTLVNPPHSRSKFIGVYALGFFLYSAAYVAFYFPLHNVPAEALGIGVGSIVLSLCLGLFFKNRSALPLMTAAIVVTNMIGYFAGRYFWTTVKPPAGMLIWGILYGIALGAGLGLAMYYGQRKRAVAF